MNSTAIKVAKRRSPRRFHSTSFIFRIMLLEEVSLLVNILSIPKRARERTTNTMKSSERSIGRRGKKGWKVSPPSPGEE